MFRRGRKRLLYSFRRVRRAERRLRRFDRMVYQRRGSRESMEQEAGQVKYVGSKSRIAPAIVPIIQEHIQKSGARAYVEPFVGGANVIDKIAAEYRIGFDINGYLIALLQYVKSGGYCRTRFPANSTRRSGRECTTSPRGKSARRASLHRITESSSAGTPGRSKQSRESGITTTKPAGIFRIRRRRSRISTSPALIIETYLSRIA